MVPRRCWCETRRSRCEARRCPVLGMPIPIDCQGLFRFEPDNANGWGAGCAAVKLRLLGFCPKPPMDRTFAPLTGRPRLPQGRGSGGGGRGAAGTDLAVFYRVLMSATLCESDSPPGLAKSHPLACPWAGKEAPFGPAPVGDGRALPNGRLTCDHRVIDGALGAELLGAFRDFIERPIGLML